MKVVYLLLVLVLSGCSINQSQAVFDGTLPLSDTMEIIRNAAESAPNGVPGEYFLKIKATGKQSGNVYLNTELDYRDQRSVTIALPQKVQSALRAKYSEAPESLFVNKTIIVRGEARRVKINFYSRGRISSKYYYQTHIEVKDISQIEILDLQA